jgi:pSer/pThr/pTyr-binding forkhead associated (FHA) protein
MTASFSAVCEEMLAPAEKAEPIECPVLVVRKGPQPGERFVIDRPRLTIGRDPKSDVFLNDMTVSRAHAVVEQNQGRVSVTDSGSLNGTSTGRSSITPSSTMGTCSR